jgi:hypothetical protein
VPLYYFETEGPSWSDYQDDDGIELQSDAEALVYAYTMIRELTADYEGSDRPLHCSSRIGFARQFSALLSSTVSALNDYASRDGLRLLLPAPGVKGGRGGVVISLRTDASRRIH